MSISPGMTVIPPACTIFTPGGTRTSEALPTLAMRSPAMSTTPSGIGAAPEPSSTWPPTMATVTLPGAAAGIVALRVVQTNTDAATKRRTHQRMARTNLFLSRLLLQDAGKTCEPDSENQLCTDLNLSLRKHGAGELAEAART